MIPNSKNMKKALFSLAAAACLLSAPAHANDKSGKANEGSEGSGGGNYLGREFVRYARKRIDALLSNPCFPKDQINLDLLNQKLELFEKKGEKRVTAPDRPLTTVDPDTGEVIPVDALNYPDRDAIEFDLSHWAALSEDGKGRLGAHEFFGLIRAEGSNDFHLSDMPVLDAHDEAVADIQRILSSPQPVSLVATLDINPTSDYGPNNPPMLRHLADAIFGIDLNGDQFVSEGELARVDYAMPAPAGWTERFEWTVELPGNRIDQSVFYAEANLGKRNPYRLRIYIGSLGEARGTIFEVSDGSTDGITAVRSWLESSKKFTLSCAKK